jgi:hypothetical protein
MGVDQPGHERAAAGVDDRGAGFARQRRGGQRADAAVFDQQFQPVLQSVLAIEHQPGVAEQCACHADPQDIEAVSVAWYAAGA